MLKGLIFFLDFTFFFKKKKKNALCHILRSCNTKFTPRWKDWKSSYQSRQVLVLFCDLVTLIFCWNCVKGVRVTKIVKQVKFEGAWVELKAKTVFTDNRGQSISDKLQFLWKMAHYRKSSICSFKDRFASIHKFSFW